MDSKILKKRGRKKKEVISNDSNNITITMNEDISVIQNSQVGEFCEEQHNELDSLVTKTASRFAKSCISEAYSKTNLDFKPFRNALLCMQCSLLHHSVIALKSPHGERSSKCVRIVIIVITE